MKKLFLLLLLVGCVKGQNNQELILDIHKCKEDDLRAVMLCDENSNCKVHCNPRKDNE